LYYSSNGHQGLGGLDIFTAKKTDLKDESSWTIRENLGTPFNSLKDDFGFVLLEDGTHTGFLTSNREGGKGKDDIYTWKMDGKLKEIEVETKPYVEPVPVLSRLVSSPQEIIISNTPKISESDIPFVSIIEKLNHNNINTSTNTTTNPNLATGKVISLKDVYYNFDKFDIREDASKDLDYLYKLMIQYPSLEIELMSHTDSRGSSDYNNTLSTNRANAVREHLIKKGIASNRMTSNGYGETELKNRCADGVECTEEEHQQNRRTEVKVTRFNGLEATTTPN